MTFPKSLIIGGIKWRIVYDRKVSGGEFYWSEHIIKVGAKETDERKFNILIHEICETIMVNNLMRYKKCLDGSIGNGDYIFSFNHKEFEIFTDELSGVLKQWKTR